MGKRRRSHWAWGYEDGLEDHRNLPAVLAAQINGGAIPVTHKTSTDGSPSAITPDASPTPATRTVHRLPPARLLGHRQ